MSLILQPPVTPDRSQLGGKAAALAALDNFPIPPWFVLSPACFHASVDPSFAARITGAKTDAELGEALQHIAVAPSVVEQLNAALHRIAPDGGTFAVRSSAVEEDGPTVSFAGQLESFLNVPASEVPCRVADVWRSAFSARLRAYRREHGLGSVPQPPAVLVQRMIDARAAGVAFSANPVSGQRGLAVVSAVPGLGDKLVSGDADSDTFHMDRSEAIVSRVELPRADAKKTLLTDEQSRAIAALARAAEEKFGRPQDIEWAIDGQQLWLLQSRPITAIAALADSDGEWCLWDNSNIAESYGGITTPLTYSFARRAYEEVYRQFCRLMCVPESTIAANADTFRCMIGLVRGRVYYNLVSWHRVLAMLPGYATNRRFMEQMMGVKESLPPEVNVMPKSDRPRSKPRDFFNLAQTLLALLWHHCTLPRQIRAFYERLNRALAEPRVPLTQLRPDELARHYRDLERQLLTRWDAPLVNDFFAMIFHGLLRKLCERWCGSADGALANELIRDSGEIISAEPARCLKALAQIAAEHPALVAALQHGTVAEARRAAMTIPAFHSALTDYLTKFGDRCLDELKLESATLNDDPALLFRSIAALASRTHEQPVSLSPQRGEGRGEGWEGDEASVANEGVRQHHPSPSIPADESGRRAPPRHGRHIAVRAESVLGAPAPFMDGRHEQRSEKSLPVEGSGKPELHGVRSLIFAWVLRHARARVRDRENLRFERTRLFGRVRRIFVEIGRRLHACDCLDDPRDVFYLELNEVLGFIDGTTTTTDLKGIAAVRRAEFQHFQQMPAPADRFETRGVVNHAHSFQCSGTPQSLTDDGDTRQGLACCAGIVRGRARVITDPRCAVIERGEILVAERTDPGWILLFPAASGVLVERGSLLSHSAIVSRELGLPGIVSIPGLTAWLKTGDLVEMNGSTGLVRRISNNIPIPASDARGG